MTTVATQAAANFEMTYLTYLDDHGLVDTSLARTGFFAILKEIQQTSPAADPTDQVQIMRYIEMTCTVGVKLEESKVKQLLARSR